MTYITGVIKQGAVFYLCLCVLSFGVMSACPTASEAKMIEKSEDAINDMSFIYTGHGIYYDDMADSWGEVWWYHDPHQGGRWGQIIMIFGVGFIVFGVYLVPLLATLYVVDTVVLDSDSASMIDMKQHAACKSRQFGIDVGRFNADPKLWRHDYFVCDGTLEE